MRNQNIKGFTLIELLVVVGIMAILAVLAAPNFGRMIAKNDMNSALSEWRSAFYLAQKEAIRLKHRVQLCPSSDGVKCASNKTNYSVGWIVRDNTTDSLIQDFPPLQDPANLRYEINLNTGNGVELNFLNNGRLPSNFAGANLTIKHKKYTDVELQIDISRAGRISNNK